MIADEILLRQSHVMVKKIVTVYSSQIMNTQRMFKKDKLEDVITVKFVGMAKKSVFKLIWSQSPTVGPLKVDDGSPELDTFLGTFTTGRMSCDRSDPFPDAIESHE